MKADENGESHLTGTEPDLSSGAQSAQTLLDSVPDHDRHERCPCSEEEIAWQYLARDKRMRRWTETIEIFDLGSSQREITIDFTLPDCEMAQIWMLPTAFLGKSPVAPDLEVRDANDGAISVPTKRENMAITASALDSLAAAGLISFDRPGVRELCRQVIFGAEFEARVARLLAEERLGSGEGLLRSLLRSLEDQFLLWVPVSGLPGCDQQISIHRRQKLARNRLLVPAREEEERQVDTAIGAAWVTLYAATARRRPSFEEASSRVRRFFGLTPFEYEHETTEAHRFASFHLRVVAPEGMIVRDLGMRVPPDGTEQMDPPPLTEAPPSESGFTYQGRESDLAHFHCGRAQNPEALAAVTTFGIRGGLTSLWAGASLFTAMLLWAIHRLAPADLATASSGSLEATVAILLIGPALASGWAIRADRGDLLESTLSGARACLLVSAVLSVAVALSLAGFQPFHWSRETAIEVYASLSYGVALVIVIGWTVTISFCWWLYREVLTSARRNYVALILVSALAASVCVHETLPVRLVGFSLLGAGLAMAAVAAHPGRAASAPNVGPVLAAGASFVTLLGAGWFLGFYSDVASREILRIGLLTAEGIVMLAAAIQWYRHV